MASKSKRRRRVLGASCILAALIVAGSSFAWFTSKDEVTNRLSASADYGVKIVESFAPPKNWLPGNIINKDVYATNTGNIGAFVEERVSGKLTITELEDKALTLTDGKADASYDFTDLVTLSDDAVYATEAGSFLAYKPKASAATLGDQIVVYPEEHTYKHKTTGKVITKAAYDKLTPAERADYDETSAKTDFVPDVEGLYVFRRSIGVADNQTEKFKYDAYYYKDGKYYKVNNLKCTPDDEIDLAGDGVRTDGNLKNAQCDLIKEVTKTVVPELTYDEANNRLVATYKRGANKATLKTEYENAAKALDKAEHELAEARAMLDKALSDSAESSADVDKWNRTITLLENELEKTQARIDELDTLISNLTDTIGDSTKGLTKAMNTAESAAKSALEELYGTGNDDIDETGATYKPAYAELGTHTSSNTDGLYKAKLKAAEDLAALNYGADLYATYVTEVNTKLSKSFTSFDDMVDGLTYDQLAGANLNYPQSTELHKLHELTLAKKLADEAYEAKKNAAESYIKQYQKIKEQIGAAAGQQSDGTANETYGEKNISYAKMKGNDSSTGLYAELEKLQAEKATLDNKKNALNTAIGEAGTAATGAATVDSNANTAAANLTSATNNYNAKLAQYDEAVADFNKAKQKYENSGDLRIFINLSDNVVTAGGIADKWQILPVGTEDLINPTSDNDTATFYYTSILQGGDTSSMLIDSVELDGSVTQDMYKSFDFDLNVELKSAQVTYDDAGNVTAEAVTDGELDTTTVSIADPAHEATTALTWS